MKTNQKWNLVIIEDDQALPGKSFSELLNLLVKVVNFSYVIVDSLCGAGINTLLKHENEIIKIDKLLKILPEVKQFDWADFFLFLKYPTSWDNPPKQSYPNIIGQSDTTIRAVDDTYIYVYTPLEEIVRLLEQHYAVQNSFVDCLEKLDYPE